MALSSAAIAPFVAAGRAEQLIAVEQHRFGSSPNCGSVPARSSCRCVRQTSLPSFARTHTSVPLRTECVDEAVFHGGRRARAAAPIVFVHRTEVDVPQFLARVGIERDQLALFLSTFFIRRGAAAHREEHAVDDREAGVAVAAVFEEPNPLRPTLGPGSSAGRFRRSCRRGSAPATAASRRSPRQRSERRQEQRSRRQRPDSIEWLMECPSEIGSRRRRQYAPSPRRVRCESAGN